MKKIFFLLLLLSPLTVPATPATDLQVKASRVIRSGLKDPASFEFVEVFKKDSETFGFIIFGTFRAKNSFGGYSVRRFIYSGKTLLMEGTHPRFNEAWRLI